MREGARISAADSRIVTEAPGTAGAEVVDTGVLDLSNTQIAVTGARARGIASYASVAGSRSSITLSRGSRVDTQDGEALLAAGGDHVFTLDSSDITARAGGGSMVGCCCARSPLAMPSTCVRPAAAPRVLISQQGASS